jgi:K+-sensing histidine kinase KdpD
VSEPAEAGTDTASEVEPIGPFRIYLGAAPGVGKTYAMLSEGQRRRRRGADVVAGFVETYGRPQTEALLNGLEIIPRKTVDYRGTRLEEMDLDAVLRRRPEIALVDELAHAPTANDACCHVVPGWCVSRCESSDSKELTITRQAAGDYQPAQWG